MNPTTSIDTKTVRANRNKNAMIRPLLSIKADDAGNVPTKLEVLQTGMWDAPYHGQFMITPEDLGQYVQNFQADVRPSSSSEGLPIDLDHDAGEAAGWIMALSAAPNDLGGWSLWADVQWTPMGQEKLASGQYKFFSPEFCPEGYIDPEGDDEPCDNVLIGGGLTNRPLFKDLTPVTASDASGKSSGLKSQFSKMFIKSKEGNVPTLDEVRVKDAASLTDEEKQILTDNKADLSADEQKKFGLEAEAPAPAAEAGTPAPAAPEAAQVAASDKKQVTISAKELADLQSAAAQGVSANERLIRNEAEAHIDSLCFSEKTGFKFKSDLKNDLVELYVSASEAQKKTLDKVFETAAPIKAAEDMGAKGSAEEVDAGGAYKALSDKTAEIMKADDKITFSDAMLRARRESPELAAAYDESYEAGKPNVANQQ